MAKKAKFNLTVTGKDGIYNFEKGKVYPDSVITKEIDENDFEDVSDEAIDAADVAVAEGEDAGEKANGKKANGKKIPDGGLE